MACESIKEQLAENERQRNALAAKLGPATDAAQDAYNRWQFFKTEGKTYSPNWSGSYDGKIFNNPYELEAYAKSVFEQKAEARKQLAETFNALFPIKDQLEKDLQACESGQVTTKENNAGTGTPGTAGEGEDASPAAKTSPTTTSEETTEPQNEQLGPPLAEPPVPEETESENSTEEGQENPQEQNPPTPRGARGLQGQKENTQKQASAQDLFNYAAMEDWRVKLKLASSANYLYNADPPGILAPLADTDGVVFPYTPQIQVNYTATYQPTDIIHSNYKIYQYQSSGVDSLSITCDFTAQDTYEANYVLAVIHFFKSVTKMFYGKDEEPVNGTPPPLCYLEGYGLYQFNNHPLAITGFNYTLPNDCDYIRSTVSSTMTSKQNTEGQAQQGRAASSGIGPGGRPLPTKFNGLNLKNVTPTYVPTKIQIQLQAIPIISRGDVSQNFSLKDYATGKLVRGDLRKGKGGGFW